MMSNDDQICLKLGREVVRMIHDFRRVTQGETGYARMPLTFLGEVMHVFFANDAALADLFELVASEEYDVKSITQPSELREAAGR